MAILCCVSASSLHLEETRSTLRFAASAKLIEMKPTVNEVFDHQALLKKLQLELAETKDALQKLQNRSDVDNSKGQSAAVEPVSDPLLSIPVLKRESMRSQTIFPDLLTESGSIGDGPSQKQEDSNWILQTPILGDSEVPPVSEVRFSMGSTQKKCCEDMITRLVQTEKRSKYLEQKLEATNDLVRTLVGELEKARRNNMDSKQGSQVSKYRDREGQDKGGFSVMKYAIYLGLLFYILGQTDKFLAAVIFIWLSQELVN
jgi:hypothetical protein